MPKVLASIKSYVNSKDSASSGIKYAKNERNINLSSNSKTLDMETTDVLVDYRGNAGKE